MYLIGRTDRRTRVEKTGEKYTIMLQEAGNPTIITSRDLNNTEMIPSGIRVQEYLDPRIKQRKGLQPKVNYRTFRPRFLTADSCSFPDC